MHLVYAVGISVLKRNIFVADVAALLLIGNILWPYISEGKSQHLVNIFVAFVNALMGAGDVGKQKQIGKKPDKKKNY